MQIDNQFNLAYGATPEYGVAAVQFADGTSLSAAQLQAMTFIGSAANTDLYGTGGAETLDSRGYATYEQGNGGADSFVYNAGHGHLEINNFGGNDAGAHGEIDLGGSISTEDVWLERSGNDLLVDLLGSQDQIDVQNWYGDNRSQLNSFSLADGSTLANADVDSLVQAMATFSASNSDFNPTSTSTMPTDTTLQLAVATAWHH